MLDEVCEFCQKYHVVAWGIGGVALAFLISVIFKRVDGRWRWEKLKSRPPKYRKGQRREIDD